MQREAMCNVKLKTKILKWGNLQCALWTKTECKGEVHVCWNDVWTYLNLNYNSATFAVMLSETMSMQQYIEG